jgi:hypothetical protein
MPDGSLDQGDVIEALDHANKRYPGGAMFTGGGASSGM